MLGNETFLRRPAGLHHLLSKFAKNIEPATHIGMEMQRVRFVKSSTPQPLVPVWFFRRDLHGLGNCALYLTRSVNPRPAKIVSGRIAPASLGGTQRATLASLDAELVKR